VLRGLPGLNMSSELSASRLRAWLSIQPKHNACSVASCMRGTGTSLSLCWMTSQTSLSDRQCSETIAHL
jgi:hypothetical protein